jgi:isoleucyl-tRNA synthetase
LNNKDKSEENIEDKWIISRLNSVIKEATKNLEDYYIERALKPVMDFIVKDFSKTYIKMIRDREDKNVEDITNNVLTKVSQLLAPFAINLTDFIYRDLCKESVHLSSWPKVDEKKIDLALEKEFEIAFKIIEAGLFARDKAQIGLKWPLAKASVEINSETKISKEIIEIIARQLNVKEIEFKKIAKDEELKVELDTKLTPELEAEGYAREISRKVQALRKEAGLVKENIIELFVVCNKDLKEILENNKGIKEMIKDRTNSKKIDISLEKPKKKLIKESLDKIRDKDIWIGFNKL